jgi:hypothetical protein
VSQIWGLKYATARDGVEIRQQPGVMAVRTIVAMLASSLLLAGCAGIDERGNAQGAGTAVAAPAGSATSCPVTEPYPPEPPFGQVWYGTSGLWTLLDPGPVIWRLGSLPVGDGMVGDKTLWFSETFSTAADEDFSGDPSITLTATRLDAPAPVVRYGHGVPSFNADIKNFLLVGLHLPAEPGCWRITATYHGAELSYVLEVRGASTDEGGVLGDLPDVARVVCDGSGTRVLTPEVRPQPDGVHFEVDNRLGEQVAFTVRSELGDASGLGADPGVAEIRGSGSEGGWQVPPGVASVRCLRQGEDPGEAAGWVELRVIDEDGLSVPSELGCPDTVVGYLDHAAGAEGEPGDPAEVAQGTLSGLREGDVVEPAGYPAYGTEALVRVVRDGRTVATLHLMRTTAGGWLADRLVSCPDAGVGA